MAKKKLLNDFMKKVLNKKDTTNVKGGRSYVPGGSGSYGYVHWDDIIIRKKERSFSRPFSISVRD